MQRSFSLSPSRSTAPFFSETKTPPIEKVNSQLEIVASLQKIFEEMAENFPASLKKSYEQLKANRASYPNDLSALPATESTRIVRNYVNQWQKFVETDFLSCLKQNSRLIFGNIGQLEEIKINKRFKDCSRLFHPDKQFFSNQASTELQALLNSQRQHHRQNLQDVNVYRELEKGDDSYKLYEAYNQNSDQGSKEAATFHIKEAIKYYKIAIGYLDLHWKKMNNKTDFAAVELRMELLEKLGIAYTALSNYYMAQAYFLGAWQLATKLGNSETKVFEIKSRLNEIKRKMSAKIVDKFKPHPQNTSSWRANDDKHEIKESSRELWCGLIPDGTMIDPTIHQQLIDEVATYSKAHKGIGIAFQALGMSAGGTGVFIGGSGLYAAAAGTTAAITLGPICLVLGGIALIGVSMYGGYKVIKSGRKLAQEVKIREELNLALRDSLSHYARGEFQKFIERLSDPRFFPEGRPLLYYRKEPRHAHEERRDQTGQDAPVMIFVHNPNHPIDLIGTMLDHGFRPDGIVFLLDLIAETLLAQRIELNFPTDTIIRNGINIFEVAINNPLLMQRARILDKTLKERKEPGIMSKATHVYNAFWTVTGNLGKVTPASYLRDYQELSMENRLKDMQGVAKLSNAMYLASGGPLDKSHALKLFNEVKEFYNENQNISLLSTRMDIADNLMIAYGVYNPIKSPNEMKVIELSSVEKQHYNLWNLHTEFTGSTLRPVQLKQTPLIDEKLEELSKNQENNETIYSLLLLDRIRLYIYQGLEENEFNIISIVALLKRFMEIGEKAALNDSPPILIELYEHVFARVQLEVRSIHQQDVSFERKIYLSENVKQILLSQLKLLTPNEIGLCIDLLIKHLSNESQKSGSLYDSNFNVKFNSNEEALTSILTSKLDDWARAIIINHFKHQTSSRQLRTIYSLENIDLNHQGVKEIWKKELPESFAEHQASLVTQLLAFVLDENINFEMYEILASKLTKFYGNNYNNVERKKIFSETIEKLTNLKNNKLSVESLNQTIEGFLRLDLDADKKNLFAIAIQRLKKYFPTDFKISNSEIFAKKQRAFFERKKDDLDLDKNLRNRIVGQSAAVELLLQEFKMMQNIPALQPKTFLFCGPTGVGKTELARAFAQIVLAKYARGVLNQERMITLCMEQYINSTAGNTLFGSPQGYIGSTDEPFFATLLSPFVEDIEPLPQQGHKKIVIKNLLMLFDEFEKAHNNVKQSLLGLFDTGKLTLTYTDDRTRRNITLNYEFHNCFVVCTSNLCAPLIIDQFNKKVPPKDIVTNFKKALAMTNQSLSPEMIGRMKVIPFAPIKPGKEFQSLLELKLAQFFKELQKGFNFVSVEISNQQKNQVLEAFEKSLYRDGVDIRSSIRELRQDFNKHISKLSMDEASSSTLLITFDNESQRVLLNIGILNIDDTVGGYLSQYPDGERFYLTPEADKHSNVLRL